MQGKIEIALQLPADIEVLPALVVRSVREDARTPGAGHKSPGEIAAPVMVKPPLRLTEEPSAASAKYDMSPKMARISGNPPT